MEIRAYTTATGEQPFRVWYDELHRQAKERVTRALVQITNGNLSNTKSVGSGVQEIRIDFGPGYRVYFGRDGQHIVVLLTGGDKRRQQRDIDAAITWWAEYKSTKREGRT
jgi:putative addiction module killer protein